MDSDFPMRMAGEALRPYVNTGQGCGKKPEEYPAKPKGGMSHGPPLVENYTGLR